MAKVQDSKNNFDAIKIFNFFNECKKVMKIKNISDGDYCVIVYQNSSVRFIFKDLDDFMGKIEKSIKETKPGANITFQMFIFD